MRLLQEADLSHCDSAGQLSCEDGFIGIFLQINKAVSLQHGCSLNVSHLEYRAHWRQLLSFSLLCPPENMWISTKTILIKISNRNKRVQSTLASQMEWVRPLVTYHTDCPCSVCPRRLSNRANTERLRNDCPQCICSAVMQVEYDPPIRFPSLKIFNLP